MQAAQLPPEGALLRTPGPRRSGASVASKASRSSPVKEHDVASGKRGRGGLSVSFAVGGRDEPGATKYGAESPGYRDEAFSFSAISNDWSSLDRGDWDVDSRSLAPRPVAAPAPKPRPRPRGFATSKPRAWAPRCHGSWRAPAERRGEADGGAQSPSKRRAPHAREVLDLVESLRRPRQEPSGDEALRVLVGDRVGRADAGCWDQGGTVHDAFRICSQRGAGVCS